MDYYFEAKQKLQITIQEWDIKGEVQGPTPKGEAPSGRLALSLSPSHPVSLSPSLPLSLSPSLPLSL
jgi:hypothetical protein